MPLHRSDHTVTQKNITRDPLLNWRRRDTLSADYPYGFATENTLGSTIDSAVNRRPYLVARHNIQTSLARSPDSGVTWESFPSTPGSPYNISGFSAEVDPTDTWDDYVIQFGNATGAVNYTTDAGATWSGGTTLPSTGNWARIRRSYEFSNTVFVVGLNKIAASANSGGYPVSWGSQTVPGAWSAKSATHIITPQYGTGGNGVVVLDTANGDTRRYLYTLDGLTWAETGVHAVADGKVVSVAWSPFHKAWFALTVQGAVYRTTALNVAWTKVASFAYPNGTTSYFWMVPAGPFFVIHGAYIGKGGARYRAGNFFITDLGSTHDVFWEGSVDATLGNVAWNIDAIVHEQTIVAAGNLDVSNPHGLTVLVSDRCSFL